MMKQYKNLIMIFFSIISVQLQAQEIIKDVNGNSYKTVKIGTQIWMTENLKATKSTNNERIVNVKNDSLWTKITYPAYCWYNNDSIKYSKYGAIYNVFVVKDINVCPTGWEIPSDKDFEKLREHFNQSKNISANLFKPQFAGQRTYEGIFFSFNDDGSWWTSTAFRDNFYWYKHVYKSVPDNLKTEYAELDGHSIRCIKK